PKLSNNLEIWEVDLKKLTIKLDRKNFNKYGLSTLMLRQSVNIRATYLLNIWIFEYLLWEYI
ncbi:hypothetical protein, partial [Nostoc sp.]